MQERDLNPNLDPTDDNVRGKGITPPETGPAGQDVAGRPAPDSTSRGFHVPTESDRLEREGVDPQTAMEEGGSFDDMGNPGSRPTEE
jgi:hypothetical protein